jgi:hypothetical protein
VQKLAARGEVELHALQGREQQLLGTIAHAQGGACAYAGGGAGGAAPGKGPKAGGGQAVGTVTTGVAPGKAPGKGARQRKRKVSAVGGICFLLAIALQSCVVPQPPLLATKLCGRQTRLSLKTTRSACYFCALSFLIAVCFSLCRGQRVQRLRTSVGGSEGTKWLSLSGEYCKCAMIQDCRSEYGPNAGGGPRISRFSSSWGPFCFLTSGDSSQQPIKTG